MENMMFETLSAKNGEKYMNVRTPDGCFRLNSNYRPGDEARRYADGVKLPADGAILLMFGIGSGYHLRALLERMPQDGMILLYEPSSELYHYAVKEYALTTLLSDRRIFLLLGGKNERDIYAILDEKIHWSNAAKQVFVVHPAYEKLFPKELALFEEIIRNNNVRIYTNRNTEMHFGEAIAENTVHNLKYVPEAGMISDLKGKFPKNMPAVLVSAGPSLDKNVEQLKEAKGRVFILAVDTALRTLKKHGVVPDATVTLDPLILEKYFEETDFADVPVFAKIQSNYKILAGHKAEKIWFDSHAYVKQFYKSIGRDVNDYHAGPSVATAAFTICAALGFRRIILIGQDLAYMGDVTHAGGEKMAIQAEEDNITYVEGVNGDFVKTRHDWLQYLHWFERVIQEVKGEIEVIDATEGGALIHGAIPMTLEQAIKDYSIPEKYDCTAILRNHLCMLSERECEKFRLYIAEGCLELEEIIRMLANDEMANPSEINGKLQKMQIYPLLDDATKKVSIPAITRMLEEKEKSKTGDKVAQKQADIAQTECYRTIQKAWLEAAQRLLPILRQTENQKTFPGILR